MSEATHKQATDAPASGDKRNYRKTLNLPKTAFPMKANLVQKEPATMKRWEKSGLGKRIRAAHDGAPIYRFHDGPPYANAKIHLGHMLNKCMKDIIVRSRTMAGEDCVYIPGWDCHGLPIEHMVMSKMLESGKMEKLASLDDDARRTAIRRTCAEHAEKSIKLQMGQMQRLLTLAEYSTPYVTMAPEYEAATLDVFANLVEQGLVFRKLKSVHWSPANETALAEAELEYYDRDDLSVYVEFDAADADAIAAAFGIEAASFGSKTPTFMIWTTTPWTLPANVLIAVGERISYSLARIGESLTIVATDLLDGVAKRGGATPETLATTGGDRLVGLEYRHPFADNSLGESLMQRDGLTETPRFYRVVSAEYVTIEDGTGLVHTAPGHGEDDYNTGVRENLPVYCPVLENGAYDDSVPAWLRGMDIFDANQVVHDWLRDNGRLFHSHVYSHSYPHDWRGKTPVIFRATEQWFIGVDLPRKSDGKTLRQTALEATEGVTFVPAWGRNRLRAMVEQRPDWCISRQRSWGLPIPAFIASNGDVLLTAASVRAVAMAVREKGSGCWLTDSPADLLQHYDASSDADAPKGIDIGSLSKMHDIFDVWFESGSSWHAVMDERGLGTPVDLYLEGSDQHRGWFQAALLTRAGTVGDAPYRELLTHGFMVDKEGRKMSKSLGNALDVDEIMRDYGADVARWWVSTLAYEHDIKVDLSFIKTAGEAYRKIRNTLRFMLSNLGDYTPSRPGEEGGMCIDLKGIAPTSLDAWALAQFDALNREVQAAYKRFDFKAVASGIYDFCNDTLSAVYLTAVKDRLYCDSPDSERRRQTQNVLFDVTDGMCRLLAPILPHTADEAYRSLWNSSDDETSVHLLTYLDAFDIPCDNGFDAVINVRSAALVAMEKERAGGGVENPLDFGVTLPDHDGALSRFDQADLADLLGVSRVTLDPSATEVAIHDLREEPRCERSWKRDGTVKERSDGGMLSDRDAAAIEV